MGLVNDSYEFHIGTEKMADKMDEISVEVGKTRAAVGIMETAVIAQEKSSADQICGRLDVGFYNVVMSQIAQRVANESANSRAIALEMMQQQKSLQNLQNRMTGDYNMISSRYAKLFGNLNQELKNRITSLDKPVIDYCMHYVKQLQNRIYSLVSGVPVLQSESLSAMQAIAGARLKSNAQDLIDAMAVYMKNEQRHSDMQEQLDCGKGQEGIYYVPFIVDEVNTDTRTCAVNLEDNPSLHNQFDEATYQQTKQAVGSAVGHLVWRKSEDHVVKVANNYLEMIEKSQLPQRIKDMMMQMFNDQFETL